MSQLTYGVVDLSAFINTHEISRQVILSPDRTTYQWTRFIFDIDTIWQPSAVSYRRDGTNNVFAPVAISGQLPALTDEAVRDYLAQPQRRLVYKVGGYTMLSTPADGYDTDCQNGPVVERISVQRVIGQKAFLISIRLVANVNESPQSHARFPILLSHRWKKWADTDDDYLTEIHTEGVAQFRTDELRKRNTVPDNYRLELFGELPQNCRRKNIRVMPSEDGSAYAYSYVDVESHFNWNKGGHKATRVQASQSNTMLDPSFLQSLSVSFINQAPGVVGSGLRGGMAGLAGAGVGVAGGIVSTFTSNLATFIQRAKAVVWGSRDARRDRLMQLAASICGARVLVLFPIGASTTATIVQDVTGKMVDCEITNQYRWPGSQPIRANPFGGGLWPVGSPSNDLLRDFRVQGIFGDNTNPLLTQEDDLSANYPPPGSAGARGTLLYQFAANGLSNPHQLPPVPVLVLNVDKNL